MSRYTISTDCKSDSNYCQSSIKVRDEVYQCGQALTSHRWADSWISPDGRQHIVFMGGHLHVAFAHSNMVLSYDEDGYETCDPADTLENAGWLHFALAFINPIANPQNARAWAPTQAQIDTLFDILLDAHNNVASIGVSGKHNAQLDHVQKTITVHAKDQ